MPGEVESPDVLVADVQRVHEEAPLGGHPVHLGAGEEGPVGADQPLLDLGTLRVRVELVLVPEVEPGEGPVGLGVLAHLLVDAEEERDLFVERHGEGVLLMRRHVGVHMDRFRDQPDRLGDRSRRLFGQVARQSGHGNRFVLAKHRARDESPGAVLQDPDVEPDVHLFQHVFRR